VDWRRSLVGVVRKIADLLDVSITSPANRDLLVHNGTNWANDNSMAGNSRMLYTTALGALSNLNVSTNRILGRQTGDIVGLTGTQAGGLINVDDLANASAGSPATGDVLAYTGSSWTAREEIPMFAGRADTAQTGWGAAVANTEWDAQIKIDTDYFTHSTTTNPEQITIDKACAAAITCDITFTSAGTGNGRFAFQIDAGSGFAAVTGGQFYRALDTAGGVETASINLVHTFAAGDILKLLMLRYALGTFNTVAEQCRISIQVLRDV